MENNSSSSSSSSTYVNPFSFRPFQITQEQIHAFHFTDRRLYKILIHDLERDALDSMNIVAFWMWLEKHVCVTKVHLIHTLVEFPTDLINEVADETLICLLSCQHEQFLPVPNAATSYELAVLPNLAYPNVYNKKLTLQDFLDNRISILQNVNQICKDVCVRAFNDLVVVSLFNTTTPPPPPPPPAPPLIPAFGPAAALTPAARNNVVSMDVNNNKGKGVIIDQTPSSIIKKLEDFPKQNIKYDHHLMFGHGTKVKLFPTAAAAGGSSNTNSMYKLEGPPGENDFYPEDRTIFITFSKGYPISEFEVKDFFTRYMYMFIYIYVFVDD